MNYKEIFNQYSTPLYLFDIDKLKQRIKYLRSQLPKEVKLCYAVKANTFIIREIIEDIDRFEICSPGEADICLKQGVPEEKMVISGVYKTPDFIEKLILEHPHIGIYTIESLEQYHLLNQLSQKYKIKLNTLIRLTSGNQFGLDKKDIQIIIEEQPYLNILGLQFFSGTQKTSLKKLKREINYIDTYITELKESFNIQELEFGPGFPVHYFEDQKFDEDNYLKEFTNLLDEMQNKQEITLELGRSIAASCGTYFTKVVDMKCNKKENYAIVDGGIHHITYYGQTLAIKVPKHEMIPTRSDDESQNWNICGSLCTVNDILIKQLPINHLQIGDIIAFKNTGAYCCSEGISLFLSRDLPSIVLCKNNDNYILARKAIPTSDMNTLK